MKGLSKSELQIQLVQERIIYESRMNIYRLRTRDSKGQLYDPPSVCTMNLLEDVIVCKLQNMKSLSRNSLER